MDYVGAVDCLQRSKGLVYEVLLIIEGKINSGYNVKVGFECLPGNDRH